jgi:hypothetical protein
MDSVGWKILDEIRSTTNNYCKTVSGEGHTLSLVILTKCGK